MTDALETVDLVEPWIWSLLSADSSLLSIIGGLDHISGTLSIGDLPVPYVHFGLVSTRDIQGNTGIIIANESLYQIKAVDATGSWDDLIPAASRIKALFHLPSQVVNVTDGSLSSIRELGIQYSEITEGVQYRHLGAQFRIRASRDE
jgi:hypothetical protein